MKQLLVFSAFILFANSSYPQSDFADSLRQMLETNIHDTSRVITLITLAQNLEFKNPEEGLACLRKAERLAKKINYTDGLGKVHLYYGYFMEDRAKYNQALYYFRKAYEKFKMNGNMRGQAKTLDGISGAYRLLGDYANALKYALKAAKIDEISGNKTEMMLMNANIGIIYFELGNLEMAKKCFFKQLDLAKEVGTSANLSSALCNVGNIYIRQQKYGTALGYYNQSLNIDVKNNDYNGMSSQYTNIGNVYEGLADSALEAGNKTLYNKNLLLSVSSHEKSLELSKQQKNTQGIIIHAANLGRILIYVNKFAEAENFINESLQLALNAGDLASVHYAHTSLAELYKYKGDFKNTLAQLKLTSVYHDSLFSSEKNNEITRHQLNYEFEKKEAKIHAGNLKKVALRKAGRQRQLLLLALVAFLALATAIIAIIVFRSLKTTRAQKQLIEKQKLLVEEKQKEIIDSIHYARRIQQALLPSQKYIFRKLNR